MTPAEMLAAVRKLHAMHADEPLCQGCNDDLPFWPCDTARLVYSPEEITEVRIGWVATQFRKNYAGGGHDAR